MKKILILEDDLNLAQTLKIAIENNNFAFIERILYDFLKISFDHIVYKKMNTIYRLYLIW